MFVVVGSGPAGVACAHALLQGGATVTMLDAGIELDPDRRNRVMHLRAKSASQWKPDELAFLRKGVEVSGAGIPLKLAYGSSFPYGDPGWPPIAQDGVDGKPSFARGGLSNVWGASVLPFRAEEMEGWPIGREDLAPHYRAVLGFMPFAARSDGLAGSFPLFHDDPGRLENSRQGTALLADLERSRSTLRSHGVEFGASRLAVRAASKGGPGCVYCGLCMYGCPYDYIYNSARTLDALRENPRFTYRSGVLVESLEEGDHGVQLVARELSGAPAGVRADRVFIACGVFSTARIVLSSLDAYEQTVKATDNCYFLLPLLRYRKQRHVAREPLHTLAQVFLEVNDPAVGPHVAHLQVYSFNELYRRQFQNMFGPLGGVADRLLTGRTLIVQGYLHSELSPGIELTLHREGRLELAVSPNDRTRHALTALKRRLWLERSSLRAWPLSQALRVGRPGRGFHTGGTFPMRAQPRRLESDALGTPHGFTRVHVVDSSVLPTLPATTITLSVMANAHRIGAAVVE